MNAIKMMELGLKYGACPQCGSTQVGNGAGKLIVEDMTFERSCACGWKVLVDEDDKPVTLKASILLHVAATAKIGKFRILELHDEKSRYFGYLNFDKLKEKGIVKTLNQTKKINEYLQTPEGYEWSKRNRFYSLPI